MYLQVLSESVGKALELTGGADVEETATFVHMFDRFFDTFNVTNFTNWASASLFSILFEIQMILELKYVELILCQLV